MKRLFQQLWTAVLVLTMMSMVSVPAFAESTGEQGIVEEQQQFSIPEKTADKAVRTIMLYDCGANLETQGGLATYNLLQVLRAKFSANGSVRFIVMTGGSEVWQTESDYLYDPVTGTSPEKINTEYNQIWEAMGADAPENPGKLVLVDGDGVLGDGENAKRAQIDPEDMIDDGEDSYFDRTKADNYEWMTNPEVLKAFINYCAEKYPAEYYDLILWDHGGGPMGGFGSDENDYGGGFSSMTFSQIVDALYDNTVVRGGGKFDFIDFDACLMNGLEFDLALAGCAKYYIASPELEPGYGQDFEGWMNALGEDPAMDTFRLGKKIVDDFVAFYDKEEGDGSSQEGTLAVIDLEALMNSKLLEDLSYLCDNLDFDTGPGSLYYDELRSVSASLNYGDMSYIDLGNLVSQLGYVYKEANWNNVEDNVVIDTNGYTEAALSILSVLNDPSIIYAGGTKGIKTEKQYYRDADGTMQYGQQGTSGVYLFFPTPKNASSTISYYKMMGEIIGKMEQDAPERTFLDAYRQTMLKYTLIYYTGQAVSEMFDQGKEKQDIDVDSVIEHWKEGAETEEDLRISTWSLAIKPLLDLLGGEEAMTKWLDYNIYQMTREAILRKNITVTSQKEGAGSNYTVEITDSRKQVVDNVVVNLIAELPAYEAFLDLPENREDKDFWMREFSGQKIGSINGELVCDVDPERDGYVALVEWLHEEKSTWNLPAMEEKWYAIQDAEGTLHVAAAEVEDDGVYVLTGSPVKVTTLTENGSHTNYEWQLYYLHFVDGQLLEIYFKQESGGYRAVPVSELVGELEVTPAISLSFFIFDFYFPISLSPFTISEDTVKDISLVYTDVKNIPDIRDTNGDGRALTTQVTIRNIYGYETDITDIVAESDRKPSGGSSSGGGTIAAKYNVVLPDELSNGSVESSLNKAKKGEKVTFTVTPENGYQTASVAVKDAKGNEVEIIDNGDGTYSFTMPDSQVTIIPAFTEIKEPDDPGNQACPRDDSCPITPFTDTNKNEWYHDGVHWAIEKGVMNGTGENTFEPLTATSRAMIVTMLWRIEGSPVVNDQMAFKDVPDDMWFTDAIRWAAASGIVTGYDEDTFGTYDSLTREQMATILYRSAQSKGQGFTGSWAFPLNFDDADQISEWADEAMHWMIMNDIIQGMSDTELSPQGDTVRAQVATMLMRFCDKVS